MSFLFIKTKSNMKNDNYKFFYQKTFDYVFNQIDMNMREIGYGDVLVNKNMKFLVKTFYNILLNCEKYRDKTTESKKIFFNKFLDINKAQKSAYNELIIDYFDKFHAFCFDLSSDSVLKGDLKFNYK